LFFGKSVYGGAVESGGLREILDYAFLPEG
jgi:hypothetical protein